MPIIPDLKSKRTSTPRVSIQQAILRETCFSSEIVFWKGIQVDHFALFSFQLVIYYIICCCCDLVARSCPTILQYHGL